MVGERIVNGDSLVNGVSIKKEGNVFRYKRKNKVVNNLSMIQGLR